MNGRVAKALRRISYGEGYAWNYERKYRQTNVQHLSTEVKAKDDKYVDNWLKAGLKIISQGIGGFGKSFLQYTTGTFVADGKRRYYKQLKKEYYARAKK